MSYLCAVDELYAKDKCIGVSEYTFVGLLPDNLKSAMPTVQEIENDLLDSVKLFLGGKDDK